MVFSSPTFISLFLPLTLALYFLLPKAWNNAVLVAASLVFYGWGDPLAAFALIIPSVALNFQLGRLIGHSMLLCGALTLVLVPASLYGKAPGSLLKMNPEAAK